jgi:diacylglycerol kinase family enzyme
LSNPATLTETSALPGAVREPVSGEAGRPHQVKSRTLLVVNPRATTVSARLKKLVQYALRGRYEVEAVVTEGPNHATELTREAIEQGYDLVVAFGGDGTVNETANGLAGSRIPLAILPGGCTNVVCRMLGIPTDIVDATEHLLELAGEPRARAIDLGRVNDRWFVSSSGLGMDADTTRWVDDRPRVKSHAGPFFFSVAGAATFGRYLHSAPLLAFEANGKRSEGVSAVVQNSDPYTFFNERPVRVCEGASIDGGTLSAVVLRSARRRDLPALAWKLLSGRSPVGRHSQALSLTGLSEARAEAMPGADGVARPFSVQVDGDYIGDFSEARFAISPASLLVVT